MPSNEETVHKTAAAIEQLYGLRIPNDERPLLAARVLQRNGLLRQEMTEERRFYTNAHVTPSVTFEQRRYVTEWEKVPDGE